MVRKETALSRGSARDPFALLRQMTSELDRMFDESGWPAFRWPFVVKRPAGTNWLPDMDVFEKDGRLVAKVDLPGMTKDDVKVEVGDGRVTISGERKSEVEEKKGDYYRCERAYGSFVRTLPLPDGVKLEDVKASFADGVLEVSIPLPATAKAPVRTVEITDGANAPKAA